MRILPTDTKKSVIPQDIVILLFMKRWSDGVMMTQSRNLSDHFLVKRHSSLFFFEYFFAVHFNCISRREICVMLFIMSWKYFIQND